MQKKAISVIRSYISLLAMLHRPTELVLPADKSLWLTELKSSGDKFSLITNNADERRDIYAKGLRTSYFQ